MSYTIFEGTSEIQRLVVARAVSYTIFEGTSEIQRLVVARAVSGLHIP